MKNWRDVDWLGVIANYKLFITNGDILKELIEGPIKQFLAFLLISDWILLRLALSTDRTYIVVFGLVAFPLYILFKYKLGESKMTLRFQNKVAEFGRKHNDNQFSKLVIQVDEIWKYIKKRDRADKQQED